MSQPFVVRWRSAVHKSRLPKRAKLVAYALSMFMDSNGEGAFPSGELLAARSGLSRRTVVRAIGDLRRGWLNVSKKRVRRGVGGAVNTYKAILPPWLDEDDKRERGDAFGHDWLN